MGGLLEAVGPGKLYIGELEAPMWLVRGVYLAFSGSCQLLIKS
jgi:hypothetical protein